MMSYVNAFIVGGALCLIAQILTDNTNLKPAAILVGYVTIGTILGALGWYEPLVKFGGAGATIPLTGFGYTMSKSIAKEIVQSGFLGVFTGGIKGAAAGITAAIVFGYLMALIFNPKTKS